MTKEPKGVAEIMEPVVRIFDDCPTRGRARCCRS